MRILVIGTGTIGRAVATALSAGNEIISASLRSATVKVDIADPASIQRMYRSLGTLDAVVCAAGQANGRLSCLTGRCWNASKTARCCRPRSS